MRVELCGLSSHAGSSRPHSCTTAGPHLGSLLRCGSPQLAPLCGHLIPAPASPRLQPQLMLWPPLDPAVGVRGLPLPGLPCSTGCLSVLRPAVPFDPFSLKWAPCSVWCSQAVLQSTCLNTPAGYIGASPHFHRPTLPAPELVSASKLGAVAMCAQWPQEPW